MNFKDKLERIVHKNNSILCVGLDVDKEKMPSDESYIDFNKKVIDQTKDLVCAYKINMAFYEVFGKDGIDTLEKTIKYIPKEIIVVIDGKRNDIGNTAKKYAENIFENLKADATTLNPYLGIDGIKPFLDYKDKCSFILCRTSNPSATDFQDLKIKNKTLYTCVAEKIKVWNKQGCCGAVVGATYPDELKLIRKILGEEIPILIPGIGAQGGDIKKTAKNGTNKKGEMAIINSSRSIIYAGSDEKVRQQAQILRDEINKYR
jgi:orotidine 5'-phosphate decarboxylase subfamily 2